MHNKSHIHHTMFACVSSSSIFQYHADILFFPAAQFYYIDGEKWTTYKNRVSNNKYITGNANKKEKENCTTSFFLYSLRTFIPYNLPFFPFFLYFDSSSLIYRTTLNCLPLLHPPQLSLLPLLLFLFFLIRYSK